jgi:AcrR family transcriptional regulator
MTAAGTATRERILKTALELFSSRGYDATSIREICAAAGITKPTVYHFFGSKEGLYHSLVHEALDRFRGELTRVIEVPGTAEERLKRVSREYFRAAREQADLVRFLLHLGHSPAGFSPPTDLPRFYEDTVVRIMQIVEAGVAAGEIAAGPADLRMLVFMGAVTEALSDFVILGRPELTPELADALTETILAGWRPR